MLPIVIVSPVIAAGSVEVAAVVDSSVSEQDEKDIVKITKRSRGIYIFIVFLSIKHWRSRTKKSQIQTIQSNCYTYKN